MITRKIVVLFALAFLATLGYGIMIPTLSVHAHSHGASHADIGVIISAFAAAQLLTQVPMGRLSDVIGRVYMVVIGFGLMALAATLYHFATGSGQFTLLQALAGQDDDRVKQLAAEYHIRETVREYQDLITMPEVEAVSVCVPNILHAPVAIAALQAVPNASQPLIRIEQATFRARLDGQHLTGGEAELAIEATTNKPSLLSLEPCTVRLESARWQSADQRPAVADPPVDALGHGRGTGAPARIQADA